MIERRRKWHAITALGQHTRSNYIGRGMISLPLDSTHSRQTLGVAFHHRLWAARTDKRRWARHDITALGQHTRSNDVGHDMSSPPLDNTLDKTTSSVACHHHRKAGQRSNDVGRVMTSPLLDSTHGRTTSGVACHHRLGAAHTFERR